MRVLVTGHEGYIGSVLVPMLRRSGHDVIGLDVGLYADGTLGPAPEEVKALRVDLRDVLTDEAAKPPVEDVMAAIATRSPVSYTSDDLRDMTEDGRR